jgi:hypothetical protein
MVRVRFLEVTAADLRAWNLRRNREDRDAIAMAIKESIDEM